MRALGWHTDDPPPVLDDPELAARMRRGLARLFDRSERRYSRLFLRGIPLLISRRERPLFAALEGAGLVMRLTPTLYDPCVRLFPIGGKFIATDLLRRTRSDQVFSLMFEQVYLVRNMGIERGDRVLELCLGSGVNSLFAADEAVSVAGVDRSPRALEFTRFNAALNGQAGAVQGLEGSLFEPVAGRRFDLVLVNPPFELVPSGGDWFLHSHGGEDGLDVVREILAGAADHLTPEGRLEMITWSPGSPDGPELVRLLEEMPGDWRIRVELLIDDPLEPLLTRFRTSPDYGPWRERLAARRLDRIHMIFIQARRGADRSLDLRTPAAEVAACRRIASRW